MEQGRSKGDSAFSKTVFNKTVNKDGCEHDYYRERINGCSVILPKIQERTRAHSALGQKQEEMGASTDLNVGPAVEIVPAMKWLVKLSRSGKLPLCLDSTDYEAIRGT